MLSLDIVGNMGVVDVITRAALSFSWTHGTQGAGEPCRLSLDSVCRIRGSGLCCYVHVQ